MSSIRAEMSGDTDELLQRLNRLSHLETRGVLNSIAEGLRTSTVERFTEEKTPEGTSWKPSIRAQEEGGKTLTKTTQLKTSIRSEVSDSGLAVGTNDIRAATHQFGDERTIRAKNKKYLTFKIGGQWKRVASVKVSILCRVFGKRFDEAKEDILRARDEGMVATCSHEMLPVHGADRRLTRYEGEHPENFRSRIAMYEEICKLGGTNEGVLLAVRTLGYTSPVLVRANDLTGFSHFTLDGSWLLDGSRTLESDTIENRWAEFYIVIVMDADEEHPISFDIMRKTVRKWKEVGAKDNYFFKYNLSIRQPHTGNFLEVLYKKHLFYYDYRKLDGMWKLDGSYMLDAEMTPVGTRIGYRYESLYELHEAGLAVMAYNYACRMVESAILKAAYSFRMYYFEYLKTDGSWITDGSHVVDAEMSPREMRWSTTFHHQHEEELLLKQRYRMQPCEEEYSIRKTLERYRMVIDYFDYLKLNGLWKLTGSRLMDAQRTEYTTKQAYSFGVEHTREDLDITEVDGGIG